MACARDVGMVFVHFHLTTDTDSLLGLVHEPGATPPCLRVAYRVPIGRGRILAQDQDGKRVYVVGEIDTGLEVIALGREPPSIVDRGPEVNLALPMTKLWDCTSPTGERGNRSRGDVPATQFKWNNVETIRQRRLRGTQSLETTRTGSSICFWAQALSSDAVGASERARGSLRAIRPTQRLSKYRGRRWSSNVGGPRSTSFSVQMDPGRLAESARKHRHHLLALACLAANDIDAAAIHLEQGAALTGSCNLKPLNDLRIALGDGLPTGTIPLDLPPLRQLLAVIGAADACLARGDHRGVLGLFERSVVWELHEAQSINRSLAAAHLALNADTNAERLRKSLALAIYVGVLDENRVGFRIETVVPGATWSVDRIDGLAEQANAWLASEHAAPRR